MRGFLHHADWELVCRVSDIANRFTIFITPFAQANLLRVLISRYLIVGASPEV